MRMTTLKTLIFGGRIYTMEARLPVGDAMIVAGDRIEWIGSIAELSAVPSDAYKLIDLGGRVVVPGFIDSHTHLVFWALSRVQIDLDGARSYEEALERIRKFLKANPPRPGAWVIGKGWKKEQWRTIRWPHRRDLDRIIRSHPVAIYSKDEHQMWVNTMALKMAGITEMTPDPDGGEIKRDPDGTPTGVLKDKADVAIWSVYRQPSAAQMKPVMQAAFEELYRRGCVAVTSFDSLSGHEMLQYLDVGGNLPVRVNYYFPVTVLDEVIKLKLRSGYGSDFLKVGGIKIFSDGALGSQTALMLKPFRGQKHNCGIEVTSRTELTSLIRRATRAGLACAIHAIGDRANRNVLDAYEMVGRHASARHRHRIEHCQIVNATDLPRFKRLGVIASVQPSHATADIDIMKRYLGNRRKDSYRMRTLTRLGVPQCYGSDAPIEELHPLHGIYAAVTGKPVGGAECFNRSETVTVEQALRGFTIAGAAAVGDGAVRGSLAPGKLADFVVLNRDICRNRPEDLLRTEVVATFIGGELKYAESGFLSES
ncbi:MAG: amidohydrolase [candidate division Zixibacteria bacterium]|nr:amidohydrolase [candidate division Zixibacteria bacterium]